jgi:hypothetical protein
VLEVAVVSLLEVEEVLLLVVEVVVLEGSAGSTLKLKSLYQSDAKEEVFELASPPVL